MKRSILILAILLFAFPVHAQMLQGIVGASSAAAPAAYCTGATTCTATNPGQCDQICEDFEGSTDCDGGGAGTDANCRYTAWTYTTNAGCVIDNNAAMSGTNICTGTVTTNGVTSFATTGSAIAARMTTALAGDIATPFVQIYFNITSDSLDDTGVAPILSMYDASSNYLWNLRWKRSGTNRILSLIFYNQAAGNTTVDGTATLTANTWYRLQVNADGAGNIAVKINGSGTNQPSGSTLSTTRVGRQFRLGPNAVNGNSYTIQYKWFTVDDDTEPGACL